MTASAIIGIVLIKNEDLFVERVLANILDFCDEIIVADNISTDNTSIKVRALQEQCSKIKYHTVNNPSVSHELITKYASTDTWVFAVDGDELYDPSGLALLREQLRSGKFADQWMILGNVLNCVSLDCKNYRAQGYLAPPCRSMTKLYNFSAIKSWNGPCSERLHGGNILFKEGFSETKRFYLYKEVPWAESYFRCLHLCFIPRSSKEKSTGGELVVRKNIADKLAEGWLAKSVWFIGRLLNRKQASKWKREKYMQGELVTLDISTFFNEQSCN